METENPDHDLIMRIAQKDIDAYRLLIGRHLNKALKFAERMLGNRQDAEDIIQDTCLKIWNEAERWQPRAKFSTWLYRVIFNACMDYKRKVVPLILEESDSIADDNPSADDMLIVEERAIRVRKALQLLPERQRAALILSYYEEVSNQDAADTLEIPLGAFQQLLFRARHHLKEELKVYEMEVKSCVPKKN